MLKPTLRRFAVIVCTCLLLATTGMAQESLQNSVGVKIENSELKDVNGTPHSLFDEDSQLTVVVFMGWECPLVKQYVPRLKELRDQYREEGVRWIAINPNQHDSLTELQHFARSFEFDMPILKDVGNVIADQFGAERTPEAFVVNRERQIVYQGKIDDQFTYGRQRPSVVSRFLADAIEQSLEGEPVSQSYVEPDGCIIGRLFRDDTPDDTVPDVTYTRQVSRILQKNCTGCHRAGEIAPFELMKYDEVVGWAGMIQEVVNERRMPPWHANPEHGEFSNDCRLTEGEIELINRWVDSGAPQGDPKDLPEPVVYTTGWQIGEPDAVFSMEEAYPVPATGTVEYVHKVVDPGFTEDKWITAAECRADKRAVVHHIIVGVLGEGDFRRDDDLHNQVQSDWIAASAPGSPPMILPTGYAKFVPAGSRLVFQMHYTPNGVATSDQSSIGLKFIDASEVTHRVYTMKAISTKFEIPPGDDNYEVKARPFRFDRDAELLSLFPHMHLRGKSFNYTATYPNAEKEVLLDVPNYDFNWQNAYLLPKPKRMPQGTRIRCVAHFDNSEDNIANPDPTTSVRWGDQTWEEMMIGYFNVALPVEQ